MKIDLFRQLCMNFNREPSEDLYKIWNEELDDFDELHVEQAVKNIMLKDKFFPTLSRIIEEIKILPPIELSDEIKRKRMEERGIIPQWLRGEVVNQQIDKETEDLFEDFNNFIEEFRNETIN